MSNEEISYSEVEQETPLGRYGISIRRFPKPHLIKPEPVYYRWYYWQDLGLYSDKDGDEAEDIPLSQLKEKLEKWWNMPSGAIWNDMSTREHAISMAKTRY